MAATENRTVNVFINSEVKGDASIKDLKKQYRLLSNEIATLPKNSKEYQREIAKLKLVDGELTKHRQKIKGIDSAWGQAKQNLTLIKGIALAAIGSALVSAFKSAAESAKKFQTASAELQSITGVTAQELTVLQDSATRLAGSVDKDGVRITASATEILGAFKKVGSAKPELLKSASGMEEVTKQAIILSEASGLDLDTAIKAVTSTLNQFDKGAEQAGKVVDILAAGAKYGAGEVDFLSAAIVKSGTAMNAANVPLNQGVAVLELFAEKGLTAENSGITFRNILLILQKDTKNYTDGVFDMNKALGRLSERQGDNIGLMEEFGKENVSAAQILAKGTERVAEMTEQVKEHGVATEQAAVNTNTLTKKQEALSSKWESYILKLDSGQGVISSIYGSLLTAGGKVLDSLGDTRSEAEQLTDEFIKQAAAVDKLEKVTLPLADRYDELSEKTVLNAEEQDELNSIIIDIGKTIPTAITEFDNYGKALGINTGIVRAHLEEQKALAQFLNKDAITAIESQIKALKEQQKNTQATLNSGSITGVTGVGENQRLTKRKLNAEEVLDLSGKLLGVSNDLVGAEARLAQLKGEQTDAQKALNEASGAGADAPAGAAPIAPKGDDSSDKKEQAEIQRLIDQLADLAEARNIAAAGDPEIAAIEAKYANMAELAHGDATLIAQIEDEKQLAITEIQRARLAEREAELSEARKNFEDENYLSSLNDYDRELVLEMQKWDEKFLLAEQFRFDTEELTTLQNAAIAHLMAKHREEDEKAAKETTDYKNALKEKEHDMAVAAYVSIGNSFIDLLNVLNDGSSKNSAFQKALSLFSIALNQGVAIAQGIASVKIAATPIDYLAQVAGVIGSVVATFASVVAIVRKAPEPTTPEFRHGVTGFSGGMATVGEDGQEKVFLPSGADVINASATRKMNMGIGLPMPDTSIMQRGTRSSAGFDGNGEVAGLLKQFLKNQITQRPVVSKVDPSTTGPQVIQAVISQEQFDRSAERKKKIEDIAYARKRITQRPVVS